MPPTEKLTILFLAANPEKTNRVKLDEEAHAIDDVLRRAEFRIFDLRTHWALRYGDLPELLLRYNPHIVHFSGHGSTLGDIALQDDSGKMHMVQPDALAALFEILRDNIRCVVLNACYSQIQAEGIAKSIDFVVGMDREIKDTAAINFAAGFYRGLGFGRTIKTAFDLGCIEIGLAGILQTSTRPPVTVGEPTGTPVLGGTASIPQLLALRSDPSNTKLQTGASSSDVTASQTTVQGNSEIVQGGIAIVGNEDWTIKEVSTDESTSSLRHTAGLAKEHQQGAVTVRCVAVMRAIIKAGEVEFVPRVKSLFSTDINASVERDFIIRYGFNQLQPLEVFGNINDEIVYHVETLIEAGYVALERSLWRTSAKITPTRQGIAWVLGGEQRSEPLLPLDLKITPGQFRQFNDVLLAAYPARQPLEQMLRNQMDVNLNEIASEHSNLRDSIFMLLRWAESRGRMGELVIAAITENPGNPDLRTFAGQLTVDQV